MLERLLGSAGAAFVVAWLGAALYLLFKEGIWPFVVIVASIFFGLCVVNLLNQRG